MMTFESVPTGREIGLDLLEATARLDGPLGLRLSAGTTRADFVALAFAVRARRLLRGAYMLLDGGLPEAASALHRVMTEYLIVDRWTTAGGDERAKAWAIHDLRERRVTLRELLDNPRLNDDETRRSLEGELAATEDGLRKELGPNAPLSKRAARAAGDSFPSLQEMADESALDVAYSYAYRVGSQTDVHATPVAIDAVFEDLSPGDPGYRLRTTPRSAMQGFDLYLSAAFVLTDILSILADRMPELGWGSLITEAKGRLQVAAVAAMS